ncbi:putative reverse transcriptase domain-containing protein [Tanacetum coccineum]
MGVEEAHQDPNIMTGTFTLNDHYATTLFNFGANYSFVSTTFLPLLDIEPSDLGFSYEIEIASGQLVEIDKVIRGCNLEIEGHKFDINLIPFGSGSFDVIIGMDWLSNHKAEIICHEKVTKEKEQEELVVVRDFPKVFLDDLFGLPLVREVEFQIELIPGATPIAKSPYRLAPSELEELSGQLKGLHDKALPDAVQKNFVIYCDASDLGLGSLLMKINKDTLCNTSVLALLDGPEDFVVYFDASGLGLGCVLMKRNKIELFSDYDCEIHYHLGKTNVVADALSRKARVKPKRVRAMSMTLQSSIKDRILAAQKEASDEYVGLQRGIDEMIELRNDGALYYLDQIWVSLKCDVRTLIMDEAHKSNYSVHLGADKMYYDLRDRYWWPGIKKDIAVYQPEIPEWKWEGIAIDFITKLRRTSSGHDTIWVIMDRLTKSAHFQPMRKDYKMDRLAKLYLNKTVTRHGVPISIIFDRDSWFTSRFWQSMQEALGTRLDMSTAYHPQTDGPELEQEITEKISQIKDRLKAARDHQKGKLAPRFVGPFEVVKKVGLVAYRLDLLEELNGVHDTFHVSNLKKCLANTTLQVPLDEIRVDHKLNFVEESMEIMEQEFKKFKRSRIAIVKVRWNSKRGPEFMWEHEDQMKLKYPPLFSANNS